MPRAPLFFSSVLVALCFTGYGCSDSSAGPDPDPVHTPSADLTILKSVADDGSPAVGESVVYTLRVSNAGPDAATVVAVRDSLPEALSFLSASNGGTESGGVVSWPTLPTLSSGSEVSFTVTGTLAAMGSVTNTGWVSSPTSDPAIANNRSQIQVDAVAAADLSVTISTADDGTPAVTDTLTYSLLVANAGPNSALDVVITDTLPDGVVFSSASASGTEAGGVVSWDTIQSLSAGADTILSISVTILSGGTLMNTGTVAAPTWDPVPENNAHHSDVLAATVSVSPDRGPPGTVIRIGELSLTGVDSGDLRVFLGGEEAPLRHDDLGQLYTAIPLFLDAVGESSPPGDPVDLVITESDREILKEAGVVTVLPLIQAPGEAHEVLETVERISSSLQTIMAGFGLEVGEEERYFAAMFAALDSLIHGSEGSLASTWGQLQGSDTQMRILDGLLKGMAASEHLTEFETNLEAIAAQAPALEGEGRTLVPGMAEEPPSWAPPSPVAIEVSDQLLALKMQFYVVLVDFGEQVIGNTGQTFSQWVGTLAGVAGIARAIPQVEITMVILAYIDLVVNKVIVGLLPSTLDALDLQLQANNLSLHQKTNATIYVHASNTPPGISLQYIIGNILTLLGASGGSQWVTDLTDALVRTATFYLTTMRGIIATYAAEHPELNMDPDLLSVVPDISWKAKATTPAFLDLKTFSPNIVEPLSAELNWQARDQVGVGRIYVMPSSSNDARILPGYYGGAFGNEVVASQVRSVVVGSNMELEVSGPSFLDPGEQGQVSIRAGYREQGGINWTSGINIAIQVDGGAVTPLTGLTDSNGYFTTTVEATDADADVIRVMIVAQGANQTYAGQTLEIDVGWRPPVVRVRASNVDDRAYIHVNGTLAVEARWGRGPGGILIGHQPGDSGWIDVSGLVHRDENQFLFRVWNNSVCCYAKGTFEVEVDGAVVITRVFEKVDATGGWKYSETVILTL